MFVVMLYLMYVQVILRSVIVAEWPPFGNKLLTRSLCILVISNLWFRGQEFGSDCTSYSNNPFRVELRHNFTVGNRKEIPLFCPI